MVATNGLYPPIFRIDVDAAREVFGEDASIEGLPNRIVGLYNSIKEATVYKSEGEAAVDENCHVAVYRNVTSRSKPSPWIGFYAPAGIAITRANSQSQHFVCFMIIDGALYAHTGGHASVVFERFIDLSFPIEAARRIAMPEVKRARSSQISGAALVNDVNFRDPRRITYTESLENVWTALSGQVKSSVIEDPKVRAAFGSRTKLRLEISSSIRFGPRVETLHKLVDLVRWLAVIAESPLPENDEWAILDAIKILSPRKSKDLILRLKTALAKKLVDQEFENLALSNLDASLYANASLYVVTKGREEIYRAEARPELVDVMAGVSPDDRRSALLLEEVVIASECHDLGPDIGTSGTLLAHLHGELRFDERTYFLLAGRWYEVAASYVELVRRDLLDVVESLDLDRTSIGLRTWGASEDEGDYNKSSMSAEVVINGDRVLTDNVELFDTLSCDGDRTYLIHVKRGFDVKIRDVRSQIINAANIIESELRIDEPTRLHRHHSALVRNGRTSMSQADFLTLVRRPRTYILAYGSPTKVARESLQNFKSTVARMEIVTLAAQFRQVAGASSETQLRIAWIEVQE